MFHNLHENSSKSRTESWISTNTFPLPTTRKVTKSANKQSIHLSSTCACSAIIDITASKYAYLSQSSLTTPQPLLPINALYAEVFTALIHRPHPSTTTTNSPHLLQKSTSIEWRQCITTTTTSSNVSTTNKVRFMLRKLDTSLLTIGSCLIGETARWSLGTISH